MPKPHLGLRLLLLTRHLTNSATQQFPTLIKGRFIWGPKSQRRGKVSTFEPSRKPLQYGLQFIKVNCWLFYTQQFLKLLLRVGSSFFSTQLSTRVLSLVSKKCCHVGIHVLFGIRTLDPMWRGRSQLPGSQRLRLFGLTSSDLGLGTMYEMALNYPLSAGGKWAWK